MTAIGRPHGRGVDLSPHDPFVRRVEEALASVHVDPLYRRRLRSEVVNRHVAIREGHLAGGAVARPLAHRGVMGALGRACLYASVALAGSAAGVLAASQSALPGDTLYGLKLRIDALRLETAPADLRTAVAEYIVGERFDELTVLAADGEWARAADAAAAAGASAQELAALLDADPAAEDRIHRHLEALAGLIDSAPPAARGALVHATAVAGSALESTDGPRANGNANGAPGADHANRGNGGGGNGSASGGPANAAGNAGGDESPDASPSATPLPAPSEDVEGQKGNPKDDAPNADEDETEATASPSPSPSPTPRPSRPPQANQDH